MAGRSFFVLFDRWSMLSFLFTAVVFKEISGSSDEIFVLSFALYRYSFILFLILCFLSERGRRGGGRRGQTGQTETTKTDPGARSSRGGTRGGRRGSGGG